MSETVTSSSGGEITFSTHVGPGGQKRAQVTLAVGLLVDDDGDAMYAAIPAAELDQMCREWIRHRLDLQKDRFLVVFEPKGASPTGEINAAYRCKDYEIREGCLVLIEAVFSWRGDYNDSETRPYAMVIPLTDGGTVTKIYPLVE